MKRLLAISFLALAACTPKDEPLAGAPKADEPGMSGPKADAPKPDDNLAGGGSAAVLPGVIDLAPPPGTQVAKDCERTVSPSYDHPPAMTCLYFLGDGAAPPTANGVTDGPLASAMKAAGWNLVRTDSAQRYFERPKPGTDCADAAVMVVLSPDQVALLTRSAGATAAPTGKSWRGYGLLASTREVCGADRMGK